MYIDTFIQAGAITYTCVDILKHVYNSFICLCTEYFFLLRDGGGGWGEGGGGGLLPLKIHGWFSTQYQAEWFSKNYVHIKNQNHSVLNSGVATVWKVGIASLIQSDSSHHSLFFSSSLGFPRNSKILKEVRHEIFNVRFFSRISFPPGPRVS